MSGRSWCFIAGRPFLPALDDPFAGGLGGTEQAVIHLTGALAAVGEIVTVAGASAAPRLWNGVTWQPAPPAYADITVAINDARLLPRGARECAIWFHNEVEFGKELRRGRLPAIIRARPTAVFIGIEQARIASALLPFRQRVVIPYGLSDRILRASVATAPPPPLALFTSQAYRGLKEVLAMWQVDVAPSIPDAKLHAFIAADDLVECRALATGGGVTISPRIGNDAVLAQLQQTRVLVAPGHVSETFCLAAAEAIAMGVPVVTLGIGSLKERVRDGIDGFICKTYAEMAEKTRALLTDDALWSRMQAAGIATRKAQDWQSVAKTWQKSFGSFLQKRTSLP